MRNWVVFVLVWLLHISVAGPLILGLNIFGSSNLTGCHILRLEQEGRARSLLRSGKDCKGRCIWSRYYGKAPCFRREGEQGEKEQKKQEGQEEQGEEQEEAGRAFCPCFFFCFFFFFFLFFVLIFLFSKQEGTSAIQRPR